MPVPRTMPSRRFTTLAAVALAGAALAGTPVTAEGAVTAHPASRAARSAFADQAAAARAKATGKPVMVASKTTETSQTIARPDGAFVTKTYVLPVRVNAHGVWRPVSAALRRVAGGWAPAALPSGVLLSPGGTGPLAVLTSAAGAKLAIRFPVRLPAPAVSGPAAVYRSVLAGVDLQVTATDPGGIAVALVVRDAKAAASPLLHRLRLALAAARLGVHASGSETAFTDPAGVTEYSAPPPVMWDSRHARPGRAGQVSSTAAFPGAGARTAPVRTALTPGGITLAPDPALLTAGTRYPVFITAAVTARQLTVSRARPRTGQITADNNTFNNTVKSTQQYAGEVKSACPGTAGLQGSTWEGVGYQDFNADCNGGATLYRAIYRFDVSNLAPQMVMESATLEAWVQYGADFGCSHTWPVTAHWVTKIDSSTTWNSLSTHNNDPALKDNVKPGPNVSSSQNYSGCSVQSPTWNITDAVATAASNNYTDMSWAFYGDEQTGSWDGTCNPSGGGSENCGFMGIGNNPDILTVYDLVPPAPTMPPCNTTINCAELPSPQDNPSGNASAYDDGCNAGAGGWLDQTTRVSLRVFLASKITNESVQAHFSGADNQSTAQLDIGPTSNGYTSWYASGGETNAVINNTLQDGHSYTWMVQAVVNGDGTDVNSGYNNADKSNVSNWAGWCTFKVDTGAPDPPSVTSSTFPPSGGTTTNGHSGTFTFSSTDPVPGGCNPSPCLASGVYGYIYSLNGATPVTTTASSVPLTIGDWGMNILQVQAEDNAGNTSQPSYYSFYVPWNSGILPHPGDVDGDGTSDLLAITSGALNLYNNPTASANGLPAPTIASASNASPNAIDGADWSTFAITHRGSVTQQGSYDDLWALGGAQHTLYLYQNNPPTHGAAPQYGNTAWASQVTYPSCSNTASNGSNCTGYPPGWSSYTQILSPGDAWTGALATSDPSCNTTTLINCDTGVPSLLAIDSSGRLWAFQGQFGNALANPILLASSGWSGMTLIAPGQVEGQLQIWARNNSTGALNAYTISVDGHNLPSLSTATAIPGITITKTAYPVIASAGDNNSGGPPNLYAIDPNGKVWAWPGTSGTNKTSGANPPSPLSTTPVPIGTIPSGTVITQLS
jgi:hypothetical protein